MKMIVPIILIVGILGVSALMLMSDPKEVEVQHRVFNRSDDEVLEMGTVVLENDTLTSTVTMLEDGTIYRENPNYRIWAELNTQGHSPYDENKYTVFAEVTPKVTTDDYDIAIRTPVPLMKGSEAWAEWDSVENYTFTTMAFCRSGDYGWYDQQSFKFFCNESYIDDGALIESYRIIQASDEYRWNLNPNNATIWWNVTKSHIVHKEANLTEKFEHFIRNDKHYYAFKNMNLKGGTTYNVEFILYSNESMKYDIIVGDYATQSILFVLDPTITDSRSWTADADWENASKYNLTTTNDDVRLSSSIDNTDIVAVYSMDDEDTFSSNLYEPINNLNGTLIGVNTGKTNCPSSLGECYNFDGNDEINIGDDPAWDVDDNTWTLTMWLNISACNSRCRPIDTGGGQSQGIVWLVEGDIDYSELRIRSLDDSEWYCSFDLDAVDGADELFDGDWNLYTFIANGTDCATNFGFFIDGIPQNFTTSDGRAGDQNFPNSSVFYLGVGHDGSTQQYIGDMDEVIWWNRELEQSEILDIYNSGSGIAYPFSYTGGVLDDRWDGYCPQSGYTLHNLTMQVTGNGYIRFNQTNASVSSSPWIAFGEGEEVLLLETDYGFTADDCLYYEFKLTNTSSRITSYTLNEYDAGGEPPAETPAANGTLSATFKTYPSGFNHTQYTMQLYEVNITCENNDCGNVSVALDPTTNNAIYTPLYDGYISQVGVWNTIHDASSGLSTSETSHIALAGVSYDNADHYIYRYFLTFNTSTLSDNAVISKVELVINLSSKVDADNDGNDFTVVVNNTQASPDDLVVDDYNQAGAIDNPVEFSDRIDITDMTEEAWHRFNFTSEGINAVDPQGITYIAMREGHDVLDIAPDQITNTYGYWYTLDSTSDPYLNITYTSSKGLISTTPGDTPFYTNHSFNPTFECGIMTNNSVCTVSMYVNATGDLDTTHEFYWIVNSTWANVTQVETTHYNITIVEAVAADSCTYSGSGDWEIDCTDSCDITTAYDLGGSDVIVTGAGLVKFQTWPSNYSVFHIETCTVRRYS